MYYGKTRIAHAWLHELVTGPKTDECLPWPFLRYSDGYGRVRWEGASRRATHVALIMSGRGDRPQDQECLHSCNRPSCVNPRHIRWGTSQENSRDAIKSNRVIYGEASTAAKLSSADVEHIKSFLANGNSVASIARRFQVGWATVADIQKGRTWVRVPDFQGATQ